MRKYLDPVKMSVTGYAEAAARDPKLGLPRAVDFREAFGPVRDQGEEGSCTGFALAGQMQALRAAAGLPFVEMSPAFVYYEERQREGTTAADAGADPADGLRILQTVGCAPEQDAPYVEGAYAAPPGPSATKDAALYKIADWWPVVRGTGGTQAAVAPILELLARGTPVNAAIIAHRSLENAPRGQVPMPGPEDSDPVLGGHDVVLSGYRMNAEQPDAGTAIFRNSWGTSWGEEGHGYLPFAYLADPNLTTGVWAASLGATAGAGRVAVLVSGRPVTEGDIVNGETVAPLRPVVEALGATIEYANGAVRIAPGAAQDPLFGVDSAQPVTRETFAQVRHWASVRIGFWGRYLGTGGGAAVPLSATEAQVLHQLGVAIAPIYNDVVQRELGAQSQGESAARTAVLRGRALGIPRGVVIFADIEHGWPITGLWLYGWASTLAAESYRPGVYLSLDDASAQAALKSLKVRDPSLYRETTVWNARWLVPDGWNTFRDGRISTPPFSAPALFRDVVGLWQFAGASDGGRVDLNLRNPERLMLSALWS